MQEMQELEGDSKINFNSMYRDMKVVEDKESMIYNSLGEVQEDEDPDQLRLYRKFSA
jgi:hypothetical protein